MDEMDEMDETKKYMYKIIYIFALLIILHINTKPEYGYILSRFVSTVQEI